MMRKCGYFYAVATQKRGGIIAILFNVFIRSTVSLWAGPSDQHLGRWPRLILSRAVGPYALGVRTGVCPLRPPQHAGRISCLCTTRGQMYAAKRAFRPDICRHFYWREFVRDFAPS